MQTRRMPLAGSAWSRRELLVSAALFGAGLAACNRPSDESPRETRRPTLGTDDARRLEAELQALLDQSHVPGFADDPAQAPDLTSYEVLGLFPLVTFAHFDNPDFETAYRDILMHALENGVDFVTLKERQFIVVEGDRWRIIDAD